MKKYVPKMTRLTEAFEEGKALTISNMIKTYRVNSPNSATGIITHLRQRGLNLKRFYRNGRGSKSKYAIATNTAVIKLAKSKYKVLA
jgi:hypothetical protein